MYTNVYLVIQIGGIKMKCKCDRCGFEIVMSVYKFVELCFGSPYCPKCGKYMNELLEDEL